MDVCVCVFRTLSVYLKSFINTLEDLMYAKCS